MTAADQAAQALAQVMIVDGFGTAQAEALGQLHAAAPRPARTTPDPAVLEGLRKIADSVKGRADRVEAACEVMHDAYEAAAPRAGWSTQTASRVPWADVPEPNKATMRIAVRALIEWLEK
jgi:hypothetical protein